MRKAVGFIIVLWALSKFFTTSFEALDLATTKSLNLLAAIADSSRVRLLEEL